MNKDEYVEFEKMAEYEQNWSFPDKISNKLYLESLVKFIKLQFSLHIRYCASCFCMFRKYQSSKSIDDHK